MNRGPNTVLSAILFRDGFLVKLCKIERVPGIRRVPAGSRMLHHNLGSAAPQFLEYRVPADSAKPIPGIPGVWLRTMDDCMPVTSLRAINRLRDLMTLLPPSQEQKKSGVGRFGIARLRKQILRRLARNAVQLRVLIEIAFYER